MKINQTFLLTSFQTWLPEQTSNASDDLLVQIQQQDFWEAELYFLRQLVVDVPQASAAVIAEIEKVQPEIILCCGMAQKASYLRLESNGTKQDHILSTQIDLDALISQLNFTRISHNAGKFVCEGLYYEVLNYLQQSPLPSQCLFVHVPVLTPDNQEAILADFVSLLRILAKLG
jgi:pyroglutamyl-peptidase